MAYGPGKTPFGDTKSSSSLAFEEFVPPSGWTEDTTCHYLLIDLPGFKRQELKLQFDNQTHLIVSGERQARHNKYMRFEQRFELPKNADSVKIIGKLDGEILYITVPKKVEQEQEKTEVFDPVHASAPARVSDEDEDENENKSDTYKSGNENENENKSDTYENENKYGDRDLERTKNRRGSDEAGLFLRLAIEKLRRNKGIVVTALFAFSLGVLLTQKFQSSGP